MSKDLLDLSDTIDYFVKKIYYTLVLPHPIAYINAVLKVNGNGDLFWESENDQHFCQRCNSKLECIESQVSIFSENKEKILKCKNCGWC